MFGSYGLLGRNLWQNFGSTNNDRKVLVRVSLITSFVSNFRTFSKNKRNKILFFYFLETFLMFHWRTTIGTLTELQAMKMKSLLKYPDLEKIHIYLRSLFHQRVIGYYIHKNRSCKFAYVAYERILIANQRKNIAHFPQCQRILNFV